MLKITSVTLYKHGLGHFVRSGNAPAELLLTFPRRAMDDVLKSLTAIPSGDAVVRGIAFETPDDRNEDARRRPITFDAATPLSSLLHAFAGYTVNIATPDKAITGTLIGLEKEDESHLKRGLVAVSTSSGIALVPLATIQSINLDDARAKDDLSFALTQRQRDEDRATARITFSGPADVDVSYIAPAPAWRVSYRVLIGPPAANDDTAREITLQGWGLFDNTLEEDLDGISLTLTAGMPVSFRYALHQPNTPDRPLLRDEVPTVDAPIAYSAMAEPAVMSEMADATMIAAPRMARGRPVMAKAVTAAAPVQASGETRGALFAYTVNGPVTVKRGESGMVPIVAVTTRGSRDLLYNAAKHPHHPAASVRFKLDRAATLERGPAVVLDNGHYGGEAVVPFTAGGGEVILAFALELGITVRQETSHREETVRLSFNDQSVFIETIHYQTTTYEATSSLPVAASVVIEHPRHGGQEFVTTPVENNLDAGRFRLAVPASSVARLAITTRQPMNRFEQITGLTGDAVQRYLANKLLDRDTAAALDQIRADDQAIHHIQSERAAMQGEVKAVRQRLEDCRKSLAALTAPSEAAQRARFAAQLEEHDAALQALDQRDRDRATEIERLRVRLAETARKLSSGV